MGMKHVEAFGDSLLVVQQFAGTFQCLDGSFYNTKCDTVEDGLTKRASEGNPGG
jgi:hypothetical protein